MQLQVATNSQNTILENLEKKKIEGLTLPDFKITTKLQ